MMDPNSLVQNLKMEFGDGTKSQLCYLYLIENLASECQDDEIVIEESIRTSYFDYMDLISQSIVVALEEVATLQ